MKELDLQNATLLKKFLKARYDDYEIRACQDICTLVKMSMVTLLHWFVLLLLGVMMLGILSVLLTTFSLITLYLPDGYQAPLFILELGAISLAVVTVLGGMIATVCVISTLDGDMQLAPEYMKRPLRKLFKKKSSSEVSGDTSPKEKAHSQTWIAVKEMCKSVKEKTCIKVKL